MSNTELGGFIYAGGWALHLILIILTQAYIEKKGLYDRPNGAPDKWQQDYAEFTQITNALILVGYVILAMFVYGGHHGSAPFAGPLGLILCAIGLCMIICFLCIPNWQLPKWMRMDGDRD